jgi:hypothetical protein
MMFFLAKFVASGFFNRNCSGQSHVAKKRIQEGKCCREQERGGGCYEVSEDGLSLLRGCG